jgi:hypothetical protein
MDHAVWLEEGGEGEDDKTLRSYATFVPILLPDGGRGHLSRDSPVRAKRLVPGWAA